MSNIPSGLKYTKTHEWVKQEQDGIITIGITDHAQSLLGDIVFIELPEVGEFVEKGNEFGVVESVKAAADIYSPLSGEVIETNQKLYQSPDKVNQDPYGEGWIIRLKVSGQRDLEKLLSPHAYQEQIVSEAH